MGAIEAAREELEAAADAAQIVSSHVSTMQQQIDAVAEHITAAGSVYATQYASFLEELRTNNTRDWELYNQLGSALADSVRRLTAAPGE